MRRLYTIWDHMDVRHSVALLRVALGGIFLGFGLLKFFPGLSPAAPIAERTFAILSIAECVERMSPSAHGDLARVSGREIGRGTARTAAYRCSSLVSPPVASRRCE